MMLTARALRGLRGSLAALMMPLLLASAAGQKRASDAPDPIAVVETSVGSFEIDLDPSEAPRAVENFTRLAQRGYFDGTPVYRVVRDSLVFMGDPTGTGAGGESIYGRTFPDELATAPRSGYPRGLVAMAHPDLRDANTSIFFVTLRTAHIPPHYTVFGHVRNGLDVLDAIGSSAVTNRFGTGNGRPQSDILITRITIR